jgi:excisionase family DNA binding protein
LFVLDSGAPRVEKEERHMEKLSNYREPLMTTATVSKWLGVSTRTLCLWAECQEIPAIKLGRQWRFRESELSSWLHNPEAAKLKKLTLVHAAGGN